MPHTETAAGHGEVRACDAIWSALTAEQAIARARALLWLVRRSLDDRDAAYSLESAQALLWRSCIVLLSASEKLGLAARAAIKELTALVGYLEYAATHWIEERSASEEYFADALDAAIEIADAVLAALGRVQAESAQMVR